MDYEFNGISIDQEKESDTESRLKAYADKFAERKGEKEEDEGK